MLLLEPSGCVADVTQVVTGAAAFVSAATLRAPFRPASELTPQGWVNLLWASATVQTILSGRVYAN